MPKPNIECLNCGEMFYKKPFRIKKDKIHTCSMKCYGEYLHKRKVKEIEDKFNKPIKELLEDMYINKMMSARKISKEIGLSYNKVCEWLKENEIPIRYGSEAIETQWINNTERRKLQAKLLIKNCGIEESVSRFEDYSEYRKTSEYSEWRLYVWSRDKFCCVKCGAKRSVKVNLNAHHLNSFKDNIELRFDVNNGVTLCESCHIKFHALYSNRNNTRAQFEEYLKAD